MCTSHIICYLHNGSASARWPGLGRKHGWLTEGDVWRLPYDVAVGSKNARYMRAMPCSKPGTVSGDRRHRSCQSIPHRHQLLRVLPSTPQGAQGWAGTQYAPSQVSRGSLSGYNCTP